MRLEGRAAWRLGSQQVLLAAAGGRRGEDNAGSGEPEGTRAKRACRPDQRGGCENAGHEEGDEVGNQGHDHVSRKREKTFVVEPKLPAVRC
jgi:hypothetical protein